VLAVGKNALVYVSIQGGISRYTLNGEYIDRFDIYVGGGGSMAFDDNGSLYVANPSSYPKSIRRYDANTGAFLNDIDLTVDPLDIEWRNGELLVLDRGRIKRYTYDGLYLGEFFQLQGGYCPSSERMEFAPNGKLYISCYGTRLQFISEYDATTGAYLGVFMSISLPDTNPPQYWTEYTGDPLYISMLPIPSATPTNALTSTPTPTRTASRTPTLTPTLTPAPVVPPDTVGVYQNGTWSLRFSNSAGAADITATFGGASADLPIVGDWNGDAIDTVGVYRNNEGRFILSNSNLSPAVSHNFIFGSPGDTPIAGKWVNPTGSDGVGVFRPTNGILYQKAALSTGFSDYFAIFGNPGDVGFSGDWNKDGLDSIGIYRSALGRWYITQNSQPNGVTFADHDFFWNVGTGRPIVGDWDGDRRTTVGYRISTSFVLHDSLETTGYDIGFTFGASGAIPVVGKWTSQVHPNVIGILNQGSPVQPVDRDRVE
jgi:hypothetical protein